MNRADLRELLSKVRARPRMWLPDERYTTLVAFVTGCDCANEGRLLRGFNEWLAQRYLGERSSLAWISLIGDQLLSDHEPTQSFYGDLDERQSEPLVAEMLERLDEFLAIEA